MTADRLPAQVREFATYLNGLLARLDPSGGWCAVFWQRDPEGMRACLDGREMPPWDVVESLLRDLAGQYGPGGAGPETEHARSLHTAALAAYDSRPGGREALGDRLDVMLREQKFAAERQAALARQLTSATTGDQADALRRDLAWARDDHARATARCAELRTRMARTDRRGPRAPEGEWGEAAGPHGSDESGQARGGGDRTATDLGAAARYDAPGGGGTVTGPEAADGDRTATGPGAAFRYGAPGGGKAVTGTGLPAPGCGASGDGRAVTGTGVPAAGYGASGDGRAVTGTGVPAAGYGASGDGRAVTGTGVPAAGYGAPGDGRTVTGPGSAARHGTGDPEAERRGRQHAASRTEPREAATGGVNASAPLAAPEPFVAPAALDGFAASASAPAPRPTLTPSQPPSTPQPAAPKARRRRRGGARFAGAVEEDVAPGVVPAVVPGLPAPAAPAGGRTPRGARFAGAADEAVEERPVGEGTAATGDADRDEVARVVETLARLRGEGRSGEAHALLAEAASWGPARFPLLAERLHHAGLDADWQTLLWEAASLPAGRLVAAADALAAAGRASDARQMLRQGVARPPGEIGLAVLALAGEGRRREVRVLLDAYVTARTPEEAARSAEPDPQRLVPLLLEAAAGVSDERRWDLVHALRVAGHPA
ncbi:hypothetical protein [Streptomyces dubilierae]|uniref:UL36 very large tegument protein n=1 Tax=Streptomyces dubilierae TaxID=3075533 RepID=A0ABU2P9R3_9ACTN|nr:hypothetical protein [Streptomyces sp. DSM 41921]MDT0387779.1 hypothetical protein [Streptomyces sp. DSM 41921]